jgi:hypothetical protein
MFKNWWEGSKINLTENNGINNDNKIQVEQTFYVLTQNIRNSQSLTNVNIDFIETLDKDKLIELIKLYNINIVYLVDFIKNHLD